MKFLDLRGSLHLIALTLLLAIPVPALAQTGEGDPDSVKAIARLRSELIDSFNKGDLDRLLSQVDPDVVVTWQNGEVCRGPEAIRSYYRRMMTGDNRVLDKAAADPKVEGRHVYGDWAVSWGTMNDEFVLRNGVHLLPHSRFTATLARRGEDWKVTSFHVSMNAFDNPILHVAVKRTATWAGLCGLAIGLILGAVALRVFGRRRRGV